MIEPMNRPNFFPGMMVDFHDFNRLSQQSEKIVSILCQYLFCNGGIIVNALDEFQILPIEGELSVRVLPGIALLPNGQAVCLNEEIILDLRPYQGPESGTLIVSLKHSVQGVDKFTDSADPSITGYRTEIIKPEFVFSVNKAPKDGIEIFRTVITPLTKTLRLPETIEGWDTSALAGDSQNESVIDFRYRPQIVPQTYVPMTVNEFIELRQTFYKIEQCHQKIARLYLTQDPFHTLEYLVQAHAEILSRPFQPLKVSFLVSEFSEKLCLYLEMLERQLGEQKSRFDKQKIVKAIELLTPFREREVIPKWRPLNVLKDVAQLLEQFVNYGAANFHLATAVEEALIDIQNRVIPFDDKMILAGQSFERVDFVEQAGENKWSLKVAESHARSVTSQFANGDRLTLKGTFFNAGSIHIEFDVRYPDRIACILMHQYFRRAGSVLHYEINGKPLTMGDSASTSKPNTWVNSGLVVPEGYLITGKNQLKIVVEKTDLDFGFFDIAIYQPALAQVVQK